MDPTQGAQLLAGAYTTTITADDVSRFEISSDPNLALNQGDWQFTLTNDGKFSAEKDGNFMAEGKYTVKDDRIEVYIESDCEDCDCENSIGRYVWALSGDALSFAKTAGSCYGMDLSGACLSSPYPAALSVLPGLLCAESLEVYSMAAGCVIRLGSKFRSTGWSWKATLPG